MPISAEVQEHLSRTLPGKVYNSSADVESAANAGKVDFRGAFTLFYFDSYDDAGQHLVMRKVNVTKVDIQERVWGTENGPKFHSWSVSSYRWLLNCGLSPKKPDCV